MLDRDYQCSKNDGEKSDFHISRSIRFLHVLHNLIAHLSIFLIL